MLLKLLAITLFTTIGFAADTVIPATDKQVRAFRAQFAQEIAAEKCQYEAIGLLNFVSRSLSSSNGVDFDGWLKTVGINNDLGLVCIAEAVRLGYGFDRGVCSLKVAAAEMTKYRDSLKEIGRLVAKSSRQAEVNHVFAPEADEAAIKAIKLHLVLSNELMYGGDVTNLDGAQSARPLLVKFIYAPAIVAVNKELEARINNHERIDFFRPDQSAFLEGLAVCGIKLEDSDLQRLAYHSIEFRDFSDFLFTVAGVGTTMLPASADDIMAWHEIAMIADEVFRELAIKAAEAEAPGKKHNIAGAIGVLSQIGEGSFREFAMETVMSAPSQNWDIALALFELSRIVDEVRRSDTFAETIDKIKAAPHNAKADIARALRELWKIKDHILSELNIIQAVEDVEPGQRRDTAIVWIGALKTLLASVNASPNGQDIKQRVFDGIKAELATRKSTSTEWREAWRNVFIANQVIIPDHDR